MKQRRFFARVLALFLALCLVLPPTVALAGTAGEAHAYFFVPTASDPWGSDGAVTTLPVGSNGSVTFSISVSPSASTDYTPGANSQITYIGLFGPGDYPQYPLYDSTLANPLPYGGTWDKGAVTRVTIPNVQPGTYEVRTLMNDTDLVFIHQNAVTIGGAATPTITTSSLPEGYVGEPYSVQMAGSNITTWSADGLPAGLSMSDAGEITGTPTQATETQGAFVTVAASDGTNQVQKTLALVIHPARTFDITYYLNGGAGTTVKLTDQPYGTKITLPAAPKRSGYTFRYWTDGEKTYAAEAEYTVTKTVSIWAEWTEKPGVTVQMPEGLGPVVGYVYLVGTTGDRTPYLWSKSCRQATTLGDISLNAAVLDSDTYTRLSLKANVDGSETEIASWNGNVSAPAGGTANATVQLTKTGPSFTILEGVEVDGLTQGADYTVGEIRNSSGTCIGTYSLPVLVSTEMTYTVRLNGVESSPVYADYNWANAQADLSVTDGKLCLAEPAKLSDTIALSGVVHWDKTGDPLAGWVTVQATQKVGGVFRTAVAYANSSGEYTLNLYPDAQATFTALSGGRALLVTDGGTCAVGTSTVENHKIKVKDITLSADVTCKTNIENPTDEQKAVAERYLRTMGGTGTGQLTLRVTGDSKTDAYIIAPTGLDPSSSSVNLYHTATAAAVTCTLSGPVIETATEDTVSISNGSGAVSFTPRLKPGVVTALKASQTMGTCFAFFGGDGKFLGESSGFSVSAYSCDYASPCPVGTKTVALLPGSYAGTLPKNLTLDDLTAEASNYEVLTTWALDSAMAEGQIEALTDFTASRTATENALFVTKPGSTLFASADSFVTADDLISFTGSIGLDAGLTDGKLTSLFVNPRSGQAGGYINTATVQTLVIDGQSYPADGMTGGGYYAFDFQNTPIDLPCDYTLYCTPGNIAFDMNLSVTADVTWSGNRHDSSQLIGSAVVSRPGASLDTLSTYVCQDTILVSGTAQRGETVTIYDDGAAIGTAAGDGRWGEWTARVPLYGTDPALTTAHSLYAVTASGVVSDELTVIHNAAGPQLTQFTMSWKPYSGSSRNTINVGDAYSFTGAMYDTVFTARFANAGRLLTKKGWNSKVIFKVYTTDGEIRFLEAEDQGGGIFTAKVDTTLRSSVTAAEVMYEPDVPGGMTVENGVATGQAPAEYVAAVKDTAGAVQGELNDENALYPTESWMVEYNDDGTPKTIHYHSTDVAEDQNRSDGEKWFAPNESANATIAINGSDDKLAKLVRDYCDAGMRITGARAAADSQISLQSWLYSVTADASALNHIAYDERTGDAGASRSRAYSISRVFTGGTYNENEITAAQAFAIEKAFMESAGATFSDMTHTRLALENDGDSYDVYEISLVNPENDLEDCHLTATFLACDGVYSMTATAVFSPQYCSKAIAKNWAAIQREVAGKLQADAPEGRLMDYTTDTDLRLPLDDDQNSYQFKLPDGTRDDQLHTEYMRSIRRSVGLPAEEPQDEWDRLNLQRLQNYDEGADGKWSNPAYYFYNGDFKPRSDIAQSCMEDVNAYYSRQRSDAHDTNLSTAEEWTGHGNFLSACASGLDPTPATTVAGDFTAGANIVLNAINSFEAKNDLRAMIGDLDQLKNSPCYKKLNGSQKELVDQAYNEFKYWYDSAMNQISATQALGAICNVGGVASSHVKVPHATELKNWGAGVVFSGAGEMNSAVGGQMIKTSFTNAIVTYNEGYKQMKGILRSRSLQLEDPDCKGKPTSTEGPKNDGEKKKNKTGNDPSGIVYEGVIQNPVEGAAVTLYYGANDNGAMVREADSHTVTQLKLADDVRTLIPNEAVQITGADGRFQWGVPAGLWYVTAEYAGRKGNSGNDKAATVSVTGLTLAGETVSKLLPVLPVQLNVNIPLVDDTAPVVEDVLFTDAGIYVTFSKYMREGDGDDSVLNAANFTLSNQAGPVTGFTVESAEQGNAPANVDPAETKFSRTVLLKPASGTAFENELTLTVAGTVQSYAGTAMDEGYSTVGTVGKMTQLGKPTFELPSGTAVQRGDTVTILLPAGAPAGTKICYTTDGKDPTTASKVYDGPVAVTDDMTIKAIAVCVGYQNSSVASASYTTKKTIAPDNEGGQESGSVHVCPCAHLKDVDPNAWYHRYVDYVVENGLMVGVADDRFGPKLVTNRAMIVTILHRLEGKPAAGKAASFMDVKAGSWYADAVAWAQENDIVSGYSAEAFGPKDDITREQFAAILYRYARFKGYDVSKTADLSAYTDASAISRWALEAMQWANAADIITGRTATTLVPKGGATRAEAASIFTRFIENVK